MNGLVNVSPFARSSRIWSKELICGKFHACIAIWTSKRGICSTSRSFVMRSSNRRRNEANNRLQGERGREGESVSLEAVLWRFSLWKEHGMKQNLGFCDSFIRSFVSSHPVCASPDCMAAVAAMQAPNFISGSIDFFAGPERLSRPNIDVSLLQRPLSTSGHHAPSSLYLWIHTPALLIHLAFSLSLLQRGLGSGWNLIILWRDGSQCMAELPCVGFRIALCWGLYDFDSKLCLYWHVFTNIHWQIKSIYIYIYIIHLYNIRL